MRGEGEGCTDRAGRAGCTSTHHDAKEDKGRGNIKKVVLNLQGREAKREVRWACLGAPACPGAAAAHLMPKLAKGIAEERAYNIQLKGAQLAGLLIASVLQVGRREKWEGGSERAGWPVAGLGGQGCTHRIGLPDLRSQAGAAGACVVVGQCVSSGALAAGAGSSGQQRLAPPCAP